MSENQQLTTSSGSTTSTATTSTTATILTADGEVVLDVNNQIIEDPRTKFEQLLKKAIKDEGLIKSKAEYDRIMQVIIDARSKESKHRTAEQDYLIRKYTVFTIANISRMIRKQDSDNGTPKYYVYLEELYDVIHKEHLAIGHGGRDRTFAACKKWYENVSVNVCSLYINTCLECKKKVWISFFLFFLFLKIFFNLIIKPVVSSEHDGKYSNKAIALHGLYGQSANRFDRFAKLS